MNRPKTLWQAYTVFAAAYVPSPLCVIVKCYDTGTKKWKRCRSCSLAPESLSDLRFLTSGLKAKKCTLTPFWFVKGFGVLSVAGKRAAAITGSIPIGGDSARESPRAKYAAIGESEQVVRSAFSLGAALNEADLMPFELSQSVDPWRARGGRFTPFSVFAHLNL